jgi:quercetin dioxygenase-like cupin family protein
MTPTTEHQTPQLDSSIHNITSMLATATKRSRGAATGPRSFDVIAAEPGSAISFKVHGFCRGEELTAMDSGTDSIFVVWDGKILASACDESQSLVEGDALLRLCSESARLTAESGYATVLEFIISSETDQHAPLGNREVFSSLVQNATQTATSKRSFGVIFGPENGSLHATLFVGTVPVGSAPWHFHQYDEIAVILSGRGAFHFGDSVTPVESGSAFRIPARQLHVNENSSDATDMILLGLFTPGGSPSAAYLPRNEAN